jgi:2'-hydroxyisoflavone reductase
MKILIMGGTHFLGRHLVDSALGNGHELTLFNRGQTNPGLFPDLETIHGDREKDLDRLAGRKWDAVIDTCGYFPRLVKLSAENLKGAVDRYVFISSLSVHADFKETGIDESYPVGKLEDETVEVITGETYGPLKALCEQAVQEVHAERALVIRPGLIVGPYDPTDRFTYWPVRVARGGDVLAPDRPEALLQIIDARDLAGFIIRLVEDRASGVFNATGPDYELTMGKLLDTAREVARSNAVFKWAPLEFLNGHRVQPWSDLPAWAPDQGESVGFARIDISKALGAGLKFMPLEQTLRDTLDWASTLAPDHAWRAGLKKEREEDLLTKLQEQGNPR